MTCSEYIVLTDEEIIELNEKARDDSSETSRRQALLLIIVSRRGQHVVSNRVRKELKVCRQCCRADIVIYVKQKTIARCDGIPTMDDNNRQGGMAVIGKCTHEIRTPRDTSNKVSYLRSRHMTRSTSSPRTNSLENPDVRAAG